MDLTASIKKVKDEGPLVGVCSTCQKGGIELIYEDEKTVLQEHEAFGKHCVGSYDVPETVYRTKTAALGRPRPA